MKIYLNQFQSILRQILYSHGIKTIDVKKFNELLFLIDLNLNVGEFQRIVVSWLKARFMVKVLSKHLRDQLLYLLHRSNVEQDTSLNLVMIKIIIQTKPLTSYRSQQRQPQTQLRRQKQQPQLLNKKSSKTLKNNKNPTKKIKEKSIKRNPERTNLKTIQDMIPRVSLNDVKKSQEFDILLKQTLQNRVQIKELENLSISKSLEQSLPSDSDEEQFIYESSSLKKPNKKKYMKRNTSLSQVIQSSVEMLSIIDEVPSKTKQLLRRKNSSDITIEKDYNQFQIYNQYFQKLFFHNQIYFSLYQKKQL